MAEGADLHNEQVANFADISVHITRILQEIEGKPATEVIGDLEQEIDDDEISEARDYLLQIAKGRYMQDLATTRGLDTRDVQLQPRKRRGASAKKGESKDVLELFCYISGYRNTFPKEVLSSTKNFVDIGGGALDTNLKQVSDPALLHIRLAELANMYRTLKEEIDLERKEKDKAIAILKDDLKALKQTLGHINHKSPGDASGSAGFHRLLTRPPVRPDRRVPKPDWPAGVRG